MRYPPPFAVLGSCCSCPISDFSFDDSRREECCGQCTSLTAVSSIEQFKQGTPAADEARVRRYLAAVSQLESQSNDLFRSVGYC